MPMPKLEFDESTHTYTLDGRKLISVTEALSIVDDRWKIDPWYLERGRLIHLATQYYDTDELDESTIDAQIKPYFDAYVKFRNDTGFKPIDIEKPLYHPKYYYAGRIDRIGLLNNEEILIDIKSGQPANIDELQLTAYWDLYRNNLSSTKLMPYWKVFGLYLHHNGMYKLEPIKNNPKLLLQIFLAAVTLTSWKEKHK